MTEKLAIGNDDAAIAADESLFPLVVVALALEEIQISFCTRGTLIRVDNLIPFLHRAQIFRGVTQHLVQCAIGEVLLLGTL